MNYSKTKAFKSLNMILAAVKAIYFHVLSLIDCLLQWKCIMYLLKNNLNVYFQSFTHCYAKAFHCDYWPFIFSNSHYICTKCFQIYKEFFRQIVCCIKMLHILCCLFKHCVRQENDPSSTGEVLFQISTASATTASETPWPKSDRETLLHTQNNTWSHNWQTRGKVIECFVLYKANKTESSCKHQVKLTTCTCAGQIPLEKQCKKMTHSWKIILNLH